MCLVSTVSSGSSLLLQTIIFPCNAVLRRQDYLTRDPLEVMLVCGYRALTAGLRPGSPLAVFILFMFVRLDAQHHLLKGVVSSTSMSQVHRAPPMFRDRACF